MPTSATRSMRRAATSHAADMPIVLRKLGFAETDYDKRVGACSGGEQTRLALAKIVLSRPDLLILDEPTNHLDIAATEWLEGFLKSYEGAVLLVSHDRYFLDAVADTIADVENQRLTVYQGNYTHFRRQKEEQPAASRPCTSSSRPRSRASRRHQEQHGRRRHPEQAMRHKMQGAHRAHGQSGARPHGHQQRPRPVRRRRRGPHRARRRARRRASTKTFGERTLFDDLDFLIERGDRVGLVGPNGAGKTTLVKMILGTEQPTRGSAQPGPQCPRWPTSPSTPPTAWSPTVSVIDSITDIADMTETEARNYLARFLFTGDDVFKTRRDAFRRREEQTRPGPHDPRAVQPADSGRTDQPPGHRVAARP